jgi:NAD(P) transhydrogenase subunit beta
MTQMPQMVAIFNGLGGAASGFVASSEYFSGSDSSYIIMCLSVLIGTLTFSGSFIAFGKLQGFISGRAITFTGQQAINALIFTSMIALLSAHNFSLLPNDTIFYTITVLALILGIGLTIPIGGADMPVVISLLNSYSGIAAAATGFLLGNNALIISGSLVGASGLILTNIMCKGMNRSLANVIFGAVGATPTGGDSDQKGMNIKSYSTTEAAMILDAAEKIIIVPGYGLAVAQAQHVAREVADTLEAQGKKVLYAIHPVAGRMPGHMNVLLAEANVSYDLLKDLDEINPEFEDCDVALILGANDVVNPAARHDKSSPIYGMPILNVDKSRTVIINKRSMNPGFAGVQNELFGYDNSIMVFGDAKDMLNDLLKEIKEL